jgi:hypothetical protein
MIHGSNHPRTVRKATGQDTCGRSRVSSLIFFPCFHSMSSNVCALGDFWLRYLRFFYRLASAFPPKVVDNVVE